MASRYLAGMPRVRSAIALARSFSGNLPHTSAYSLNFLTSISPALGGALGKALSPAGLEGVLPLGRPGEPPPLGQLPPLLWLEPLALFSSSLIFSSSLTSTSRCMARVLGPPRVR